MRFLSVCSGIEAASVAWNPLGWEAAAFAEIAPFPCAVLAHHYPKVPNLGDLNDYRGWDVGPVQLVAGGTPCQSFSVAGLRKGLADPRGNLALVFLGLVDRVRPKWVVWENVPGVLSSGDGRDFGAFLGALGQLGYGWAYRVLDAQYVRVESHAYAVPQRRRRVFVVGCLGDWRGAVAVLFERESLSGHPAPRREAGARVAAGLTRGADSGGRGGYAGRRREDDSNLVSHALNAKGGSGRSDGESETFVAHSLRAEGFDASEDGTGRGIPVIPIDMKQASRGERMTNNRREGSSGGAPGTGVGEVGDPAPSLSLCHTPAIAYQCHGSNVGEMGTLRGGNGDVTGGVPFIAFGIDSDCLDRSGEPASGEAADRCGLGITEECSSAIRAKRPNAVAFAQNQRDELREMDVAGALAAEPGMKQQTYIAFKESQSGARVGAVHATLDANKGSRRVEGVIGRMCVRRLTPLECERLQGFPDFYTAILYRGKLAADGPRYQAIGNSIAANCLRWVGERVELVESIRM